MSRPTMIYRLALAVAALVFSCTGLQGKEPASRFKVVAFYTALEDQAHISFVQEANRWFREMAKEHHFDYEATSDWSKLNPAFLAQCQVVVFLDTRPKVPAQRKAFEEYMKDGGAWMGFHFAAFALDQSAVPQDWDWYHETFTGAGEYASNTWRPTSAVLKIEAADHPATRGLPATFKSAPNEWYRWKNDLRANKDIKVLLSIDPSSFPLGTGPKEHEIWRDGDYPVVWTNQKYRMIYFNMGHNDIDYEGGTNKELSFTFQNETQNKLVLNSLLWLGSGKKVVEPRSKVDAVMIHANQVAYDLEAPKFAVIETAEALEDAARFQIVGESGTAFEGKLADGAACEEWFPGRHFYRADFSEFQQAGAYQVQIEQDGKTWRSAGFEIGDNVLASQAIPAITGFYQHQRADSPEELGADKQLLLHGSNDRVDLRGGWCDASGDVSKYFSHLAYTNFMTPQQTPLVVWSMVNTVETTGPLLEKLNATTALEEEARYGADYLLRSLSPDGYFYMTVFSYFKKDPSERRVVGLLADSKTTSDYPCAFREGGGMGIAALARISRWKGDGQAYLAAAERAFAHLQKNNLKYCDDGKENIIDDYGALMAASELWIATDKPIYRDAARKRAANLAARMTKEGYFISDDSKRPFWHAADAGLPVVALVRYLDKEADAELRETALGTIRRALDYNLRVTGNTANPFGYARQSFLFRGQVKDGFFIPHDNESGWWWQGENARLASLATAAITGGRLVYPGDGAFGVKPELARFAADQLSWILGGNPYDLCFMYRFGKNNVPYMEAMYGHGTGRGGISNGITGRDGSPDGSGIDFRFHAGGNEWRWTEQWIPHSAWFLQAVAAMSSAN